jgi:hypothetical protein
MCMSLRRGPCWASLLESDLHFILQTPDESNLCTKCCHFLVFGRRSDKAPFIGASKESLSLCIAETLKVSKGFWVSDAAV